jgi:probable phosphoglycerate mutase
MTTTLFLVRHGETEFNTRGIYQGQLDSPLTPDGVARAKANQTEG